MRGADKQRVIKGVAQAGEDAALQVRALLEGQFLNMRLHSQWMGVATERLRLTGGDYPLANLG